MKMGTALEDFQAKISDKMAHFFFSSKEKNRVFLKMAALMDNDVAQLAAIESLWLQSSDDGEKPGDFTAVVLQQWGYGLSNGQRFYEVIQGWVSPGEIPIIRAGEDSGKLQEALRNGVLLGESVSKIKGAIIGGLIYPALLMMVVTLYLVLFSTQLVPALATVLPENRWEGAAHYMGGLAYFVTHDAIFVLVFLVMYTIFVIWSLPRLTGKIRVKLDRVPPWSLYRILTGAGFMLSVSALYASGAKEPDIIKILSADAQPYYAERLDGALRYILGGADIGTALWKAGHGFPEQETIRDLRAYARLADFQKVLDKIAREWIDESVIRVKAQANVLTVTALILMAGIIGFIITSVFTLQSQISSSAGH
jgi:type II secretory pathway component PulF